MVCLLLVLKVTMLGRNHLTVTGTSEILAAAKNTDLHHEQGQPSPAINNLSKPLMSEEILIIHMGPHDDVNKSNGFCTILIAQLMSKRGLAKPQPQYRMCT